MAGAIKIDGPENYSYNFTIICFAKKCTVHFVFVYNWFSLLHGNCGVTLKQETKSTSFHGVSIPDWVVCWLYFKLNHIHQLYVSISFLQKCFWTKAVSSLFQEKIRGWVAKHTYFDIYKTTKCSTHELLIIRLFRQIEQKSPQVLL